MGLFPRQEVLSGELLQRDGHSVRRSTGSPKNWESVGECGQSVRVGDFIGQAHPKHAPSRVRTGIDLVCLESHDSAAGRGGKFAAPASAEDDLLVIEEIANRLRGRHGSFGVHHAPDDLSSPRW